MSNARTVPALIRAHDIIQTLLRSPRPLGISDLSRELGQSKSTVHGLVHTLTQLGVLEKQREGRGYLPSGLLLELWREALLKGSLAEAAQSKLSDFSSKHDLTALAGVFVQGQVLVVSVSLAPGFSISAYTGQWLPVWASALGKAFLAAIPASQAKRLGDDLANRGPLHAKEYWRQVKEAQGTGVAVDLEEYLPGVRAMATVIPPSDNLEPYTAIWVVGLAPNLDDDKLKALAPELKTLSESIRKKEMELKAKKKETDR